MQNIMIEKPSPKLVAQYLAKWDSLENYVLQESSLDKLFLITYPKNTDINDVLIKVCSLNDFYSTNIFSPFTVAKHIVSLNIDDDLEKNNYSIVNTIANVTMKGDVKKNFYSFATKYCSHHKPLVYPIYDYYVAKILMYFNSIDAFSEFKIFDLEDYRIFREVLIRFQSFYGLEEYNLKQIDQYLWQFGKEAFPRKY